MSAPGNSPSYKDGIPGRIPNPLLPNVTRVGRVPRVLGLVAHAILIPTGAASAQGVPTVPTVPPPVGLVQHVG